MEVCCNAVLGVVVFTMKVASSALHGYQLCARNNIARYYVHLSYYLNGVHFQFAVLLLKSFNGKSARSIPRKLLRYISNMIPLLAIFE